jgi:hypothetical protein
MMEQPLGSHFKMAVVTVGIVGAVFYAVLEEGVRSGSIPYAASYMFVTGLLRCYNLLIVVRTLAVWLLCHIIVVVALLKENHPLARK